jgi:F0F1-type ATP synthase membrane subunit c/vacuolar-type H+-ATPase subunit K
MLWVGLAAVVAGVVLQFLVNRLAIATALTPSLVVQVVAYLLGPLRLLGVVLIGGAFVVRALERTE